MASDVIAPGAGEEGGEEKPRRPEERSATGSGFFHIYKSGQGYWTRMITIGGAALIGIFCANFIYSDLPGRIPYLQSHHGVALAVAAGFMVLFCLLAFWLTNKPRNADFLIATDSEMKKVNWTSRKELLGSTKVVIGFMFLIATFLFTVDVIFGYFFHIIHVLKSAPF